MALAETLTEREAFAGVALCAMYADGVLTGDEDETLVERLAGLPCYQDAPEAEVRQVLAQMARLASRIGDEALLARAAASLPPARHAEALALCASILAADEDIAADERGFVARLRKRLAG